MEYTVDIEPLTAVVRLFSEGKTYGDPYDFACTIRWIDRYTIEVLGVDTAVTPSMWRAMRNAFREHGAKHFVFVRKGKRKVFDIKHRTA